jgi:CHRD domain-containing protein
MRVLTMMIAAIPIATLPLTGSPAEAARSAAAPYHAALAAGEEVPNPGPSGGTGTAKITVDVVKGQLCYDLSWSSQVGAPSAAHVHRGAKGTNGPIVVVLNEPPSPKACVPADVAVLQGISADPGGYYVNIHTSAYPGGAVRGQLQQG